MNDFELIRHDGGLTWVQQEALRRIEEDLNKRKTHSRYPAQCDACSFFFGTCRSHESQVEERLLALESIRAVTGEPCKNLCTGCQAEYAEVANTLRDLYS